MVKQKFKNFFEAYFNLLVFLPYFFSVDQILRTLFKPWKGLVAKRRKRSFDLNEIFSVWSFNLISRVIGFTLRIFLLFSYIVVQFLLITIFPLTFLLFLLFLPLLIIKDILFPESVQYEKLKREFLQTHTLDKANLNKVEAWFDSYYKKHILDKPWWRLEELFTIPPLAKDWSWGYTVELDSVSQELTSPSYLSGITELINREKEMSLLQEALLKDNGGNVLIVGEAGVGKHTLIDALAKNIYENKVHPKLSYKRVLKLDLQKIFSKFKEKAKQELYFKELLKEAIKAGNIILVIDNIHLYLDPESQYNIKSELFEFLNARDLHIIGLTTDFAYQLIIFPQSDLKKMFTELIIKPVSKEKAFEFLLEKFWLYEKRHKIILPYETLQAVIDLSDDFITEIPFPEKAFKLLEETIAFASAQNIKVLTPEILKKYLKSKLNLPIELTTNFRQKLVRLEEQLKARILSQNQALEEVSLALKKAFLNLEKRKKPLASFLFLGPTGVGKTETAKTLAEIFFGGQQKLARIDLGFYQREEDITKLIGDPKKKIVGELVKKILAIKYGVLLLDELEKAHKKFFNTLLTLLDEGYIIDSNGKKIDCRYLFVIATSNAGYELYTKESAKKEEVIDYLIKNGIFAPEFLNRFDEIVLFKPLSFETIFLIAKRKVNDLLAKYEKEYKIKFKITDEELKNLLKESEWKRFGAREVDRVILKKIEAKIIEQIFQ